MRASGGRRTWPRRALEFLAVLVVAVVVVAGGYVGVVAIRHNRSITLPAPTGPYRVGRVMADWTDHARVDPLAPRSGQPRRLAVWLWYPATPGSHTARAPYAPGAWNQLHFPSVAGWGQTRFDAIRTHAVAGAPVAAGRFPIVVLEPGMGLAAPQYTTLAENLASRGYLVAGVTPTYSANLTVLGGRAVTSTRAGNPAAFNTAAGNRLIRTWASDARYVATRAADLGHRGRFAGHVDPTRISYVGHSFGGATAIQACSRDRHCAAAVDLDGTPFGTVVDTGLHAPLMIIGSDSSCVTGSCHPTDAESHQIRSTARALLAAGDGPTWCYSIAGTEHFSFTDYAGYYLAAPLKHLVPLGTIDGERGLGITNALLTAFLDHSVRREPEPLLAGRTGRYPEIRTLRTPP